MAASNTKLNVRAVTGWALYDVANSAFTTLVVTFIYATYFTKQIAETETIGTGQWSIGVIITALVVAISSPYLGAIADRGGYRRRFLMISTVVCVLGSIALFFPQKGEVVLALAIFTVANIAFEMSMVFYNAYLPDVAPPDKIGKISGLGWGLGYMGGLACMIIAYFAFVGTETPLFGFATENFANVRASNLLVAVWYAVFALPIFFWVKESPPPRLPKGESILRMANRQFVNTFREIRQQYRQIMNLLIARLIYNDGLVTIFAFGAIYAQGTFNFTTDEVFLFGITLNVAAGIGALSFGFLDDKLGGKTTILISLVGLFVAGLVAVLTPSRTGFWMAGILVGILAGPNQAASRSLMGRFVPPTKETEFYGFFAFSGKATSFMGPALLGLFTTLFDNQRIGVATVLIFFVIGGLLLLRVQEKEGIALAQKPVELG